MSFNWFKHLGIAKNVEGNNPLHLLKEEKEKEINKLQTDTHNTTMNHTLEKKKKEKNMDLTNYERTNT